MDAGAPKVRPICLLSELGKILESILVDRIWSWMEDNPMARLSEDQFGFRRHRSTVDALTVVCDTIQDTNERGGVAVAVSFDIKNAFNSLPWSIIRMALQKKGFPLYMRRIIDDYLSFRSVEFTVEDGSVATRQMLAGVPQGSVLGPMLWNIAFDEVLRGSLEEGCRIICYADDTLVLACADRVDAAVARANIQTGLVLNRIQRLGLTVAAHKTETVCFPGKRKLDRSPTLDIGGVPVLAGSTMKYLGMVLDNRLTFRPHLEATEKKVGAVSRALCRITPNLRGPREVRRRLYANVILSVALYAAPVWSEAVSSSRRNREKLNGLFRTIGLRVIAAYRTVSLEAVLLLARIPHLHLLAYMRARVYSRSVDLRKVSQLTDLRAKEIKEEELTLTLRQWYLYLQKEGLSGKRVRDAVLPHFDDWLGRQHGELEFHVTQILTGHGCFGSFLYRIQKVETDRCEHCDAGLADTADHTLQVSRRGLPRRRS